MRGGRGSCGRDGRKEGSRGGVGTYKRTSVLLSYEQRAVLSRALERRKKKIRALHMLTPKGEASMRRLGRALSASACTRRVECLAICPRPPPVLWFLSLTTSVHQLHFFLLFFLVGHHLRDRQERRQSLMFHTFADCSLPSPMFDVQK